MQKEGSEFALQGAIIQSAPSQAARVAPPSSFPRNYTQPQAPIALSCVCKRLYFQLVSSVAQLCLTLCNPTSHRVWVNSGIWWWIGKPGWRRLWHPTPVLLPGKSHGWRSPVGCSPWGREESDTTERLHFHFSLSCIGEGNGNPLQCSCLENPKVGGPWWAAVYGVAQSLTRLKQLSSSSSRGTYNIIELKHLDKTHTFY